MKIDEIDFGNCHELNGVIGFETLDVMPKKLPFSDRNWTRSKCYTHKDQKTQTLYGLIVLRNGYGKYDEKFFRQELYRFFDRNGINVEFKKNSEDKISFTAVERSSIIVDDGKTLIPFFYSELDTELYAKRLKSISHYTSISNARKILEDRAFIAKSLSRYRSEARFVDNENSRRLIFIVCFTKKIEPEEKMWRQFAEDHRGCKLDFIFTNSLSDAFPLSHAVRCTDIYGTYYTLSSNLSYGTGTIPVVYFTAHFSLPKYADRSSDSTILSIVEDGTYSDYTVLPHSGRNVLQQYEYQDEVRLLLHLHSNTRVEIPIIQKIEIPFDLSALDEIIVTVGKNATESARRKIETLCSNSSIIKIRNEAK